MLALKLSGEKYKTRAIKEYSTYLVCVTVRPTFNFQKSINPGNVIIYSFDLSPHSHVENER